MGSGAVAADHADAREAIQQGRNVIGLFLGDVLVQAAGPDAGCLLYTSDAADE